MFDIIGAASMSLITFQGLPQYVVLLLALLLHRQGDHFCFTQSHK